MAALAVSEQLFGSDSDSDSDSNSGSGNEQRDAGTGADGGRDFYAAGKGGGETQSFAAEVAVVSDEFVAEVATVHTGIATLFRSNMGGMMSNLKGSEEFTSLANKLRQVHICFSTKSSKTIDTARGLTTYAFELLENIKKDSSMGCLSQRAVRDVYIVSELVVSVCLLKELCFRAVGVKPICGAVIERCDKAFILGAPIKLCQTITALASSRAACSKEEEVTTGKETLCLSRIPEEVYGSNSRYCRDKIKCPVMRIQSLSMEDWKQVFDSQRPSPFIYENSTKDWPAATLWHSMEFWKGDKLRKRLIPIEIGRHQQGFWIEELITLEDFVDKFLVPSNERSTAAEALALDQRLDGVAYLAQHSLFDQMPELKAHIVEPEYVEKYTNCNIWFGTCGTVSPLHYDSYDNFLVQVHGYKYVRLYQSDQSKFLYVKKDDKGTTAQGNISRVNVESPDLDKCPLFVQATYTETLLKPGDMLFIPRGCWHYLRSLSTSISTNFWF